MSTTPILTEAYFFRLNALANCIKKYITEEQMDEALKEIGKTLAAYDSQIIIDLMDWQTTEEIKRYGEEIVIEKLRSFTTETT